MFQHKRTGTDSPVGVEENGIGLGEDGGSARSALDSVVRSGAQQMLQAALEEEVEEFLARHQGVRDEQGRREVVRNGHLPKRRILTGTGPLDVEQPRVRDRGCDRERIHFHSAILPPYLRRSQSLDELIPWLYLKGVSTGDFSDALQALLGPSAGALSANVVTRLIEKFQEDHELWRTRDLSGKDYVYVWVDGIHFNLRLEDNDQCLLVAIGAKRDGTKELLAIHDGFRESEQSWRELLLELKHRGLALDPKLAIGDGALGFWSAVRKVFPGIREQRCTVHKTANVLDKMHKSIQPKAKADLHAIFQAPTREEANKAFDLFVEKYEAKYPKAVECLKKDRDELLTFFDFPAEHWLHLRSTNVIESVFATVRLRHRRTKGNGHRRACLAMVFKLVQAAQKRWHKLRGSDRILDLVQGRLFVNGLLQEAA